MKAIPEIRGGLYLVTGGCGFIGSHLCEALLVAGARVRVLDNLSGGCEANLATVRERVDLRIADLNEAGALVRAMEGVEGVFHEAALVSVADSIARPAAYHEVNLSGTLRVLEAARSAGVKRVVFAGTSASYGNTPEQPKTEDMPLQPCSPYAAGKTGSEMYLRLYSELYGLPTVTLRYFNVYGPRQDSSSPYSGVISRFAEACRAGLRPVVYGDGLQTRDFVYVADVVRANLLAMSGPRVGRGEAVNIASGRSVSLKEVLAVLGTVTGRVLDPRHAAAREGEVRHSRACIRRARERLGYNPQYTLEEGLRGLLAEWVDSTRHPEPGG